MAQRNLSDADLELLLEIAEASDRDLIELKNTDVNRYVKKFNIKPGNDFVRGYIVYYHYYNSKVDKKMTRVNFLRQFSLVFEKVKKGNEHGFMLDGEPYDLTTEGYFKARALFRRLIDAKKGKARKKKKSKSKSIK
jgi:hypothetical protein